MVNPLTWHSLSAASSGGRAARDSRMGRSSICSSDYQRARQTGPVAEAHPVVTVVLLDGGGLGRHREPGAELPRLEHRPVCGHQVDRFAAAIAAV